MADGIWTIQKCRVFEQLSAADLSVLEAAARMRVFPANSTVYFPGDPAESIYVLVDGFIRLFTVTADGKQAILSLIQPGELFGELALAAPGEREEHAQTVGVSRVVSLPRDVMETVLLKNADLSLTLTKFVGLRRRTLERRLKNLLFRSTRERLLGLLCELLGQYGRRVAEGYLIDLRLSHQDLAGLIGVTRESVTLALGELQLQRVVKVGRQRIVVLNPDSLARLAGEQHGQSGTGDPEPPLVQPAPTW